MPLASGGFIAREPPRVKPTELSKPLKAQFACVPDAARNDTDCRNAWVEL